jgi:hypothetical protein
MTVLNKHTSDTPPDAIYIGRGSKWGNPFIIGTHGNRDSVCDHYEQYLNDRVRAEEITLIELAELYGKVLLCFCAPLRCHGHYLMKAAEAAHVTIRARPGQ